MSHLGNFEGLMSADETEDHQMNESCSECALTVSHLRLPI